MVLSFIGMERINSMKYKSIVILIVFILLAQEGFAQALSNETRSNYERVDTVSVKGYYVRCYNKADELTLKDSRSFWLTVYINGWEVLSGASSYLQERVGEDLFENLEFYLFSPIPTADINRIPELAGNQGRVDIPPLPLYIKEGDDEHLYSVYEVKGMAERYIVRPEFVSTLEIGKDICPPLTTRVPYVFMYYFRWPDKVTINKEVSLKGFSL